MLEATEGRFTVEAAIPGIAHAGDVVIVDPDERSIRVTRRVAWSKYPQLMEHRDHLRPVEETAEPLLPMDMFDAMADALRPLANGLVGFDYESDGFSFFVDESYDLTEEGIHLLGELATNAAEGARRLGDMEGKTVHRVLPEWCEQHLAEVGETVERVAWILWGASIASDVLSPPDRPTRAVSHAYAMARGAYRDLCGKHADYRAAEKAAVDEQHRDAGDRAVDTTKKAEATKRRI